MGKVSSALSASCFLVVGPFGSGGAEELIGNVPTRAVLRISGNGSGELNGLSPKVEEPLSNVVSLHWRSIGEAQFWFGLFTSKIVSIEIDKSTRS